MKQFLALAFWLLATTAAMANEPRLTLKQWKSREAFARQVHRRVYAEYTQRLDRGEDVYPALQASAAYEKALKGGR